MGDGRDSDWHLRWHRDWLRDWHRDWQRETGNDTGKVTLARTGNRTGIGTGNRAGIGTGVGTGVGTGNDTLATVLATESEMGQGKPQTFTTCKLRVRLSSPVCFNWRTHVEVAPHAHMKKAGFKREKTRFSARFGEET